MAIPLGGWLWWQGIRVTRRITLHEEQGDLEPWVGAHWRNLCRWEVRDAWIGAPLREEALFRSAPVFMVQLHHLALAWVIALGLNIVFAFLHTGMTDGVFADRFRHQVGAFALGLALSEVAIGTGLLSAAVLGHAAINRRGSRKEIQALRCPDKDMADAVISMRLGGRVVKVQL